ncbi:MAG: MATE family efflux transporter [Firmicutes bacterium]|nr:MATE family efflux transporter [Bacillota bacterium]
MTDYAKNPKQDNPLGSAPLLPLIARFAIPSVISMLVGAAYNITDQIFIGHVVGMLGNAATNVAFPTVTLTTGISMLCGLGTAANFSINQGAGRIEEARKYIHNGLTMAIIAGIIVGTLVYIFRGPILVLCGADADGNVYPYAMTYLSFTAFGLPFQLFAHSSSTIIRADGSPRYSMLCTVSGAVLNVFLDWLFMYPLGMGIKGAAIATAISQMVSCGLAVLYYPRFRAFSLSIKELGISWSHTLNSMAAGIPNFCNHMLMMITSIVLNNVLASYGAMSIYGADIPLAVSGVAQKTSMIMVSFAVGIAQGCQPIWGFNLGAKKYDRVKGAYWRAFAAAVFVGVVFFAALQLFPRQIISIFGTGDDLYFEFAEKYLKIFMMLVFFQNIQPITINYFTATGNHKQGLLVSLSRQGLFLIPLLILLPRFMGINGVLAASPIADAMAFVMSVSMVILSFKKFKENSNEQQEEKKQEQ